MDKVAAADRVVVPLKQSSRSPSQAWHSSPEAGEAVVAAALGRKKIAPPTAWRPSFQHMLQFRQPEGQHQEEVVLGTAVVVAVVAHMQLPKWFAKQRTQDRVVVVVVVVV